MLRNHRNPKLREKKRDTDRDTEIVIERGKEAELTYDDHHEYEQVNRDTSGMFAFL